MFNQLETWRHKNCTEVDIFIVKHLYTGPLYVKLDVLYWNRHYNVFCDGKPETIKIYREDFYKWKLMENG